MAFTFDARTEADAWARGVENQMDRGICRSLAEAEKGLHPLEVSSITGHKSLTMLRR